MRDVDVLAVQAPRGNAGGTLRLSCPVCRGIDWRRDGFSIAQDPTERVIERRRVAPPARLGSEDVWTCHVCGHELSGATELASFLRGLQLTHLE
jgi:hypothetical protein